MSAISEAMAPAFADTGMRESCLLGTLPRVGEPDLSRIRRAAGPHSLTLAGPG